MKIILKETILYKKDPKGAGFLFSLGSESDNLLRVNGLVDVIVQKLTQGISLPEIRASILLEYDISEAQLDQDLTALKAKLKELDFITEE